MSGFGATLNQSSWVNYPAFGYQYVNLYDSITSQKFQTSSYEASLTYSYRINMRVNTLPFLLYSISTPSTEPCFVIDSINKEV